MRPVVQRFIFQSIQITMQSPKGLLKLLKESFQRWGLEVEASMLGIMEVTAAFMMMEIVGITMQLIGIVQ